MRTLVVDICPDVVAAAAAIPIPRVRLRDPLLRLLQDVRCVHHPRPCSQRQRSGRLVATYESWGLMVLQPAQTLRLPAISVDQTCAKLTALCRDFGAYQKGHGTRAHRPSRIPATRTH